MAQTPTPPPGVDYQELPDGTRVFRDGQVLEFGRQAGTDRDMVGSVESTLPPRPPGISDADWLASVEAGRSIYGNNTAAVTAYASEVATSGSQENGTGPSASATPHHGLESAAAAGAGASFLGSGDQNPDNQEDLSDGGAFGASYAFDNMFASKTGPNLTFGDMRIGRARFYEVMRQSNELFRGNSRLAGVVGGLSIAAAGRNSSPEQNLHRIHGLLQNDPALRQRVEQGLATGSRQDRDTAIDQILEADRHQNPNNPLSQNVSPRDRARLHNRLERMYEHMEARGFSPDDSRAPARTADTASTQPGGHSPSRIGTLNVELAAATPSPTAGPGLSITVHPAAQTTRRGNMYGAIGGPSASSP